MSKRARAASVPKEDEIVSALPVHVGAGRMFHLGKKVKGAAAGAKRTTKTKSEGGAAAALMVSIQDMKAYRMSIGTESANLSETQLLDWLEAIHAGSNVLFVGVGDNLPLLRRFADFIDREDVLLVQRNASIVSTLDAIVKTVLGKDPGESLSRKLTAEHYAKEISSIVCITITSLIL
jgi:hypothetical protein